MKRRFTLIELLVVLAIIAILAVILFPVFASAREKARQTTCLSNEKQVGMAVLQYVQDSDDIYPNGYYSYGWGRGWAGQIYPYVKNLQAYDCPDDQLHKGNQNSVGYGMNIHFSGATGVLLSNVVSTAQTVYFFEIDDKEYYTGSNFTQETVSASGDGSSTGQTTMDSGNQYYATGQMLNDLHALPYQHMISPLGQHTNGSHFLLADGHAKWFIPGAVSAGFANNGTAADNTNPGVGCGTTSVSAQGLVAQLTTCTVNCAAATFSIK